MGFQIALIGLTSVNIVVADEETIVGLGPLSNPHMWYALAGLLIIGTLIYHRVPGSILIGIVVLTIFTWSVERDFPKEYVMLPEMHQNLYPIFRKEDFTLEMIPAVLSFLFIGLVDVSVTTFGMSAIAGLVREDGEVDGSVFSFWGCGLGSIVGSLMGSAPIIVYVESAAGIKEGARTGISAIMVGLLFFIAIFLAPVLGAVPQTATAPVAILVGTMMMSEARNLDWDDMSEAIPAFLTLAVMPFTFSITNGLAFGLGAALFFYISTGKMFFDIKKMYVKCKGRFTPLPTTKPTEESQLL
jgi:AGZA family xanthine/uracil permease-like MFS transporter